MELNVDPEDRETLLDQDKIVEVMLNLLNNAIRFTEEGSVLISTLQDGNACKVSVSDTGQGIPNEQLKDLFLPFVQLYGKNQKNNERGTGLGLAISKEMVEGHGGTIWAESQLGSGTIMSFTIPS